MARALKTFITTMGFFEEAVAAPSMKAALQAWGSSRNLFHHGFAKETKDAAIVAATMANPGVVLKRPVGSKASFKKHAKVPALKAMDEKLSKVIKENKPQPTAKRKKNAQADRKASEAYEREQKRREKQHQKEETARKKHEEKRSAAIAKGARALTNSEREHQQKREALNMQQTAITKKIDAEEARWDRVRKHLEAALRKAKE